MAVCCSFILRTLPEICRGLAVVFIEKWTDFAAWRPDKPALRWWCKPGIFCDVTLCYSVHRHYTDVSEEYSAFIFYSAVGEGRFFWNDGAYIRYDFIYQEDLSNCSLVIVWFVQERYVWCSAPNHEGEHWQIIVAWNWMGIKYTQTLFYASRCFPDEVGVNQKAWIKKWYSHQKYGVSAKESGEPKGFKTVNQRAQIKKLCKLLRGVKWK